MGTSSKGKILFKTVKRIDTIKGEKVERLDVIHYRGKSRKKAFLKKLEENIPHYENPCRVPRSKRGAA